MSNPAAAMEKDVTKAIVEVKERHRVETGSFKRRMEAERRERLEEEKVRMGAAMEKQTLFFEKEEEEVQ